MALLPFAPAFAILVIVPLALRAAGPGSSSLRALVALHPIAAAAALVAIVLPQGLASAGLALVWLAFTALSALHGLTRVLPREGRRTEELCVAAGFAYLAVGGGWFVLWRSGMTVAGFGEHVPLITAIHFHYAGFASPLLAGFVGRSLRAAGSRLIRPFALAAALVIAGPTFVAAGIAAVPGIEAPAAVVLAVGTAAVALLAAVAVVPHFAHPLPVVLLAISCVAAIAAMTLAVLYAGGNGLGRSVLTVDDMARWHGSLNALGYIFCGLLAWNAALAR